MGSQNAKIDDAALLVELEDLLRTTPERETLRHPTDENFAWLGRAAAAIRLWNEMQSVIFDGYVSQLTSHLPGLRKSAVQGVLVMLNKARADLSLRLIGPKSVALNRGSVFDYFDEVRKIIEPARQDVLFVDQYLDAEFISRYMPHISRDASVRLLTTSKSAEQISSAITLFSTQHAMKIEIRTAASLHDRYVFVDQDRCYHSGASFKDGARNAPTTLTQITDAFKAIYATYEEMWAKAKKP